MSDSARGDHLVPLHPEAVAGDPQRLRWVTPAASLPFLGPVAVAPGALGTLAAEGVLLDLVVEADAVAMSLRDGLSWRGEGARVRSALHEALARPGDWLPDVGAATLRDGGDAAVARIVSNALAGSVGDYVRSHGGGVELVDVCDGVVTVRLSGTCRGCPAMGATIGRHLHGELTRVCPLVREVTAVA